MVVLLVVVVVVVILFRVAIMTSPVPRYILEHPRNLSTVYVETPTRDELFSVESSSFFDLKVSLSLNRGIDWSPVTGFREGIDLSYGVLKPVLLGIAPVATRWDLPLNLTFDATQISVGESTC